MISGIVTVNREAVIQLVIIGSRGQQQRIEAIIDTGFTGLLTFPAPSVELLELSWLCRPPGILADGKVDFSDVYTAEVLWGGQGRTGETEATDTEPLVGMSPLAHHSLRMDIREGGTVTIQALP